MPLYSEVTYIGPPRAYGGKANKLGIVIHSTENTASARNEAGYARNRTDGTSSHYYVDRSELIQSLNTDYGANHVGSWQGNSRYIAYEFCGRASWSRSTWLSSIDWDEAAAQMARDCRTWGVPVRRLSVAQLGDMQKGIATHNDCRLAFGGTDHTDPGGNFPMDHLLSRVMAFMDGDDDVTAKDVWTYDPNRLGMGGVANLPDLPETPDNPTVQPAYALSRAWNEARDAARLAAAIQAEQVAARQRDAELKAQNVAILQALKGMDATAIIAHIDDLAAQDRARDEALLELVRGLAAGGATADQIVDALVERLSN